MKLEKLEKAVEKINSLFEYVDSSNGDQYEIFELKINNYFKDIIKDFNLSILAGEYIYFEEINALIEKVKDVHNKYLEKHYQSINDIENIDNQNSHNVNSLKVKPYELILHIIKTYSYLSKTIYQKHRYQNFEKYIITNNIKFSDFELSALNNEVVKSLDVLNCNISICEYDHFQSSDINRFHELLKIKTDIEKLIIGIPSLRHVIELILEKLNFLIFKWNSRRICIQNENNFYFTDDSESYFYEDQEIENKAYTSNISKLVIWKDYIQNHYEINSNWFSKISINTRNTRLSESQTNSYFDLHKFIKYHKDIINETSKLEKIKDNFHLYFNEPNDDFDKIIYNINKNYLINNYFSAFITDKIYDFNELIKKYKSCKAESYNMVYNFFLEYKLLDEIFSRLNNDRILYEKINKEILNEIDEIFNKYRNHKNWAVNNQKYIFLLPSSECLIDIDINRFEINKLFLASSFILPMNSNDAIEKFEIISKFYFNLRNSYEHYLERKIEKEERLKLSEENRANERKSIETISIFTGIITFILSSVPAFKFIDSLYQALLFTLSMGVSLGIFVALILIVTKGLKRSNEAIYFIIFTILILTITTISLLSFERETALKKTQNFELIKENKKYIKSLKEFTDSIKLDNDLKKNIKSKDSLTNK